MSIDSITSKIMKEAEAYSREQHEKADIEVKAILDEARSEAAKISEKRKNEAETDAKLLTDRRISVAGLEKRKMILSAKQEVIDECFKDAMDRLTSMAQDEYVSFIMSQISEHMDGSGELLLNKRDRDKYGARISEALSDTGITLSDENADISGGCILRQDNISYVASSDKLLDDIKKDSVKEISDMLFSE